VLSGLTARALHHYDKIGLVVPNERLAGGQRLYAAADLARIERIKALKRLLGLPLRDIKTMLGADEARARLLAARGASDPLPRRSVEEALQLTEQQLRSITGNVEELIVLRRELGRQVRALRRVVAVPRDRPSGPAERTSVA
jgi:DNA-binding transcriptional MerR regulator